MKNIRIAIQKKGKLAIQSIDFLFSLGMAFPANATPLVRCNNYAADILFLRDDDIPEYVERGVSDFGIVGENVLLEKRSRVTILKKLGFGSCRLVIAVPKNISTSDLSYLQGKSIATSYPDIVRQFLQINRIRADIIPVQGGAEIAPALDLADAVCDLVETGRTLAENNLKPIATILESQAVLIQTPYPTARLRTAYQPSFLKTLAL